MKAQTQKILSLEEFHKLKIYFIRFDWTFRSVEGTKTVR